MVKELWEYSKPTHQYEIEEINFSPFLDAVQNKRFDLAGKWKIDFIKQYGYKSWMTFIEFITTKYKPEDPPIIYIIHGEL
ncbi:MAG: hypothetical protein J6V44_03485 [Methanobrevibacter sp.]|nr:hypothetical protein [Methanobrevibacter sp.]